MSLKKLVSAYDSDVASDDEDAFDRPAAAEEEKEEDAVLPSTSNDLSERPDEAAEKKKPVGNVFLGGVTDDTSSDDSEDEELIMERQKAFRNRELLEKAQAAGKPSLPSAFSYAVSKMASNVSVFVSETEREETLHNAMLSRHVALVEKESNNRKKAGVCKAFKRGMCRRGDKCRFSHYLGPPKEGSEAVPVVVSSDAKLYTSDANDVFNKKRKIG